MKSLYESCGEVFRTIVEKLQLLCFAGIGVLAADNVLGIGVLDDPTAVALFAAGISLANISIGKLVSCMR